MDGSVLHILVRTEEALEVLRPTCKDESIVNTRDFPSEVHKGVCTRTLL